MLVLTLKYGERVVIGEDIEVVLVRIRPGQVKLGIAAPPDVEVDRGVVRERKNAERARGATGAA